MGRVNNMDKVSEGRTGWAGNMLLQKRYNLVNLCWKGYTTVRILPGANPDDNNRSFDSFRFGNQYGTWIQTVPIVKGMLPDAENGTISFIAVDSLDYDTNFTAPYKVLWFALKRAQKNKVAKSEWKDLLMQGKYGVALPKWTDAYFVNIIPHHVDLKEKDRDKDHPDRDMTPEDWSGSDILMINKTAYDNLHMLLNRNNEESQMAGIPSMDLTDPKEGAFVTFWPEKMQLPFRPDMLQVGDGSFPGYAAGVSRLYPNGANTGMPATLNEQQVIRYKNNMKPWEEILNFMSYEEQAELLSRYLPADLLMYAWENYPHWITPELQKKADAMGQYHPTATAPAYNGYAPMTQNYAYGQQPAVQQYAAPPQRGYTPQQPQRPYVQPAPAPQSYSAPVPKPETHAPVQSSWQHNPLSAVNDAMEDDNPVQFEVPFNAPYTEAF